MIVLIVGLAIAAEQPGELVGIVFADDGSPVPGVAVSIRSGSAGGATTRTDAGGTWRLVVPAGPADLRVEGAPDLPDVPVVAGRTTEVLVTLDGADPVVTIEAPPEGAAATEVPTGPPGVLAGAVTDDAGAPLPGAHVFVRGSDADATTDAEGRFRLTLPSGAWDLSVVRAGFASEGASVEVVADAERAVSVSMARAGLELADLTVTAPRIAGGAASVLDERREAAVVNDVIGAEQMSRAGDSDAASALRRVTGLTVIGGKYVYVRGLGDRYSATRLNGSSLPSPEPEKRVVPLDMFPTSLLEAVVIQKTFSPDKPAEFGGGIVEIRTKRVPEDPVLDVTISGSWVAGTTLATTDFGPTGPTDWLGFGRGWRALPAEVAAASADAPIKAGGIFSEDGYDAEELERFGEAIPNRWGLVARDLPPDFGVSANAGRRWDIGGAELGALGGVVFGNGRSLDAGSRTVYSYAGDTLQAKRVTSFVEAQNRVRLGGALSLGLSWAEDAHATSTTLLNRSSVATALVYDADDPTGSSDTHSARSQWEEQQLLFEQVEVALPVGPFEAEARYAFAVATRAEPDRRDWTYLATEEGDFLSQRGSWSEILHGDLRDTTHDAAVDLELPIGALSIKGGGELYARARTSTTRRFGYVFQGSEGIDLSAPIEDVIVPENIGAEGEGDAGYLELEENTSTSDDYKARHGLQAAYLMGEMPIGRRVRTLAGARVERSAQAVSTFELFDTSNEPVEAHLTTTDVLPAATVTFAVGRVDPEAMQVRLGYGRTLSRPELRELSEVAYYDYRSGRLLYGNPDLRRATIDNVDARWEWYPRAGENVSLGVFYKSFIDPIESVVAVSAVSGSVGTFANATRATNFGAEADVRQRLDVVHTALEDVYVSANGSLIASEVDLSGAEGNQTSEQRPLQGQSPWVLNAQVGYEDPDRRTNVAVLYNVFGPRIVQVGTSGIPDTYEMPVHRVDLVVSQGFGEHWQVRVKGANLLDWPIRETTGGEVSEETRDGWAATFALTWRP